MKKNIDEAVIRMVFIRLLLDLTQVQLAEMMEYSVSYIQKVETGARPLTTPYLMAFCLAMGVSADYVLFGEIKAPGGV